MLVLFLKKVFFDSAINGWNLCRVAEILLIAQYLYCKRHPLTTHRLDIGNPINLKFWIMEIQIWAFQLCIMLWSRLYISLILFFTIFSVKEIPSKLTLINSIFIVNINQGVLNVISKCFPKVYGPSVLQIWHDFQLFG